MEKGTPRRTLRERFDAKVVRSDGCWTWAGAHFKATGYAMIAVKQEDGKWQPTTAHRVAYELFVGMIPAGLPLDHLCRNRGCVNPAHLEPVTDQVNFLRSEHSSAVAVRTNICKHGHEFTAENTVVRPRGRDCRACVKRRNASRRTTEPRSLRERFDAKYVVREDGCWQWTAARLTNSYGAMRVDGQTVLAHRVAYELLIGPVPATRLGHTCGNRDCVNPTHLRAKGVTA